MLLCKVFLNVYYMDKPTTDNNKTDNTNGFKNIKKMYEKITYLDQYGGSVILYIIQTIVLIIIVSYCFIMINAQPIIDDWPNQRCKPNIIPVAGFIYHPEGVSAADYTYENFTYCTQNILSSISGMALEPLTFVTSLLGNMAQQIGDDIQAGRDMFDKIRTMAQDVVQEIMGRIMNFTIPLQQMIISFKDVLSKIEGNMTSALYFLLGSYYTLQSLMGAIAQFIISILIGLVIMIAVFWAVPFTWGAAIANTAIFVAISIPMAIILAFMIDVLHVKTNLKMPKLKCFDEDTVVTMNDGSEKRIVDIKVGDILLDDNEVTACIKVEAKGSSMHHLNGVMVSDSHIVKYKDEWLRVSQHPAAVPMESYDKPYLYCLNTCKKYININATIFSDWDEICKESEFSVLKNNSIVQINSVVNIHEFIDGGFGGNTKIKMDNGDCKEIKDVVVGDMLENGVRVYGVVKLNGATVNEQFEYDLGKNLIVEGGPNLVICDEKNRDVGRTTLTLDSIHKSKITEKHSELYHLLTNTKTFNIGHIKFHDYNAAIDIFLDKNTGKLLSMKYV